MDFKEMMSRKDQLSESDYAEAFYGRAGEVAQEIIDESQKKYAKQDGAAIVSLSFLMCAICLARDVSKGKCTKETFLEKAAELWETLNTKKRSDLN